MLCMKSFILFYFIFIWLVHLKTVSWLCYIPFVLMFFDGMEHTNFAILDVEAIARSS